MGNDSVWLQARFTQWLKTLLLRARIRYIQKINTHVETCSIYKVAENVLSYNDSYSGLENERNGFLEFEEKKLANAFSELPLMKREVIKLLYYDELSPKEIADVYGCSLQNVYNQKSLALKILRKIMLESGEE